MSTAAVSCSPDGAMSGGVKMGLGLTGKLGCAWVCAWVGASMHGCMVVVGIGV